MAMLLINNNDYSANVIAGSYSVIQEDVFTAWTDGNYKKHREVTREKISGSFDVFFKTIDAYNSFLQDLIATKSAGFYSMSVKVNNLPDGEDFKAIECSVEMNPVRNRDGSWNDYIERFTITIEEA